LAFEYENDAELTFQERGEDREHPWNTQESKFNRCDEQELLRNKGIKPWMDLKPIRVVRDKAEELRESEYAISRRYMQFTLRSSTERWQYSDWFGLFAELGE